MLHAKRLSCIRGEKILFSDLTFSLNAGEALLLRGPNGSGKSSLLQIIVGLLSSTSGEVVTKEHITYISHKNSLKMQQTVRENLIFWAEVWSTRDRLSNALNYFDLHTIADMPCSKLSAGWKRKVSLSRLLLSSSKLWVLDEPLVHLDDATKLAIHMLLESHCKDGGGLVMAEHSQVVFSFSYNEIAFGA